MKTNIKSKKSAKPRKLILITIITIIFLGLFFVTLEKLQVTNFINQPKTIESTDVQSTIDNNPPTAEQKAAGELRKAETNNPTVNSDLGLSITSINISDDSIQLRSVINGAISNDGSCTLELSKDDIIVSKTSGTYALPNSSTCKGFDINKSELSVGLWHIKLTIDVEGKESSVIDSFDLE